MSSEHHYADTREPERLNLEEEPMCDGAGECFRLAEEIRLRKVADQARASIQAGRPRPTREILGTLYALREEATHAHKRALEGEPVNLAKLIEAIVNLEVATGAAMHQEAETIARASWPVLDRRNP